MVLYNVGHHGLQAANSLHTRIKTKNHTIFDSHKLFMLLSHFSCQCFVSYKSTTICYIFAGSCFLTCTYQCCRRNWTHSEKPSGITIELETKEKQICHLEFQIIYIVSLKSMDWKIVVCQSTLFFHISKSEVK